MLTNLSLVTNVLDMNVPAWCAGTQVYLLYILTSHVLVGVNHPPEDPRNRVHSSWQAWVHRFPWRCGLRQGMSFVDKVVALRRLLVIDSSLELPPAMCVVR